ncbi:MAG TPA: hypothetical protein VMS01_04060 [Stellaceae bacterium]|nr:hypothetical protein [Stellaceae bacterium]
MTDSAAQIACVKREIALRERVYPKWVAGGRMKQEAADRELTTMRAVLATMLAVDEWMVSGRGKTLAQCARGG